MSVQNCRCVPLPMYVDPPADDGDELGHIWCCDPLVSLCGSDLDPAAAVEEWSDGDVICVVCQDLDVQRLPCSVGCPVGANA